AAAAQAAALGAFLNAGQVCSASERILVQRSIHDEFTELMLTEASRIKLGHPFDPQTTMGPINNASVAAKVTEHITDGVAKGANILCGGRLSPEWHKCHYFEPTVLTNISTESALNCEETFGPVAPILAFDDDDRLIAEANRNDFGLCAAVFTNSLSRAQRFVSEVETGIMNVNDSSIYWEPHIPFGGAAGKKSGIGRLGGVDTINALSDVRTAIFNTTRS
ncbi:MAG: aldehyde dehydrogenase family protein, partial [Alphaproteobacteria bacterium]